MRGFLAILFVSLGCAVVPPASTATPDVASLSSPAPPLGHCPTAPTELGHLADPELNEVSGVALSPQQPQVLFVHNDSGDSPRFFAIDGAGEVLAELTLESVPLLIDAEDLAIGPGPGGAPFIYLGDTGNNFASFSVGIPRRKAVLYRIPVPEISTSTRHAKLRIREAFPIVFTFPKGARDVEAFVVDPLSGDLFLITKQADGHSQVLAASAAMLAAGGGLLTLVGELRFGSDPLPGSPMPTSATISRDGLAILVRTYSSVFLFRRAPEQTVMAALAKAPIMLPSPQESQGEAIAFVDDDRAFVTISEGLRPAINCASTSR